MKEADIRDTKVMDEYIGLVQRDVEKIFDSTQFIETACPACGGGGKQKGIC